MRQKVNLNEIATGMNSKFSFYKPDLYNYLLIAGGVDRE